ncbi:MAG TPA: rhodanese-like domain-containing protein [Longimicrobiaceae bacterium]|jgi:hydroxyacylglutathione hydrolase|nr:rhodanese-like domain-containing protein [Longimicrobiaceae bacterium]
MILKRFYDENLAQASYMVGDAGEALVIDPARDVQPYVDAAAAEGLRITRVAETHVHADFVSGARELAARTGARLHLSAEGDARWRYMYASRDGAVEMRDGDTFQVGRIRVRAIHTPGHTPEHLCFAVTDTAQADRPMGIFTGDFVFVGDVGRPDLLEKAVHVAGSAQGAARDLFRNVERFRALPDYLQLWPGHGAGSACGKALGAVPQTTLGYEKLFNRAFQVTDEDAFVEMVLAGQPDPPRYFAEVKRINRNGPPVLGDAPRPPRLDDARLQPRLDAGEMVIDTRTTAEFGAGFVPGTLNFPLNKSFVTWAGWHVPYDAAIYLVVAEARVDEAVRALRSIGVDRVEGWFDTATVDAWTAAGGEPGTIAHATTDEVAAMLERGEVEVIDVRRPEEWEAGHVPGVRNVPLGRLAEHLDELPSDRPVVLHCQGGGRSGIAASVLRAHGVRDVLNMTGGFGKWQASGLPVEHGAPEHAPD